MAESTDCIEYAGNHKYTGSIPTRRLNRITGQMQTVAAIRCEHSRTVSVQPYCFKDWILTSATSSPFWSSSTPPGPHLFGLSRQRYSQVAKWWVISVVQRYEPIYFLPASSVASILRDFLLQKQAGQHEDGRVIRIMLVINKSLQSKSLGK